MEIDLENRADEIIPIKSYKPKLLSLTALLGLVKLLKAPVDRQISCWRPAERSRTGWREPTYLICLVTL
jgi:hypothetical protein